MTTGDCDVEEVLEDNNDQRGSRKVKVIEGYKRLGGGPLNCWF